MQGYPLATTPSLQGIVVGELFTQTLCPSASAIACLRIIRAALISRSCISPQLHLHPLTASGSLACRLPQAWQVLELATKRPICNRCLPCHAHLYISMRKNIPHPLSAMARLSFLFLTIPFIWRSSTANPVTWLSFTSDAVYCWMKS